jgi:hypothetical protein
MDHIQDISKFPAASLKFSRTSYLQVNPGLTQIPCEAERTQADGRVSRGQALAPMLTGHFAAPVRAAFLCKAKSNEDLSTNPVFITICQKINDEKREIN